MSTQDKNKKSDEQNKLPRRPLPQSDISSKRKEIFDLSKDKKKLNN